MSQPYCKQEIAFHIFRGQDYNVLPTQSQFRLNGMNSKCHVQFILFYSVLFNIDVYTYSINLIQSTCLNKDPGPPNLVSRFIEPCFIKLFRDKGQRSHNGHKRSLKFTWQKPFNNIQFWSGLLHVVCIDETRKKYLVKAKNVVLKNVWSKSQNGNYH